jgi:hypothetical protein
MCNQYTKVLSTTTLLNSTKEYGQQSWQQGSKDPKTLDKGAYTDCPALLRKQHWLTNTEPRKRVEAKTGEILTEEKYVSSSGWKSRNICLEIPKKTKLLKKQKVKLIIVRWQLIQLLRGLKTKNSEPENIRAIARVREGLPGDYPCFEPVTRGLDLEGATIKEELNATSAERVKPAPAKAPTWQGLFHKPKPDLGNGDPMSSGNKKKWRKLRIFKP